MKKNIFLKIHSSTRWRTRPPTWWLDPTNRGHAQTLTQHKTQSQCWPETWDPNPRLTPSSRSQPRNLRSNPTQDLTLTLTPSSRPKPNSSLTRNLVESQVRVMSNFGKGRVTCWGLDRVQGLGLVLKFGRVLSLVSYYRLGSSLKSKQVLNRAILDQILSNSGAR